MTAFMLIFATGGAFQGGHWARILYRNKDIGEEQRIVEEVRAVADYSWTGVFTACKDIKVPTQ